MSSNHLQAIDLFCGAGGLSQGFSQAGFDIVAPVDNNDEVSETYSFNHQCDVLTADISKSGIKSEIQRTIQDNGGNPDNIDLVIGGPPCKGFSQANVRTRHDENPLNDLPGDFLDVVEAFNPQAVVMENVPKILTMSDGSYRSSIKSRLIDLGYNVKETILNAEEFGVPQSRRRAFFIATQHGKPPIPDPTHSKDDTELPDPISVREAILDLPRLPDGGGGSFKMKYEPRGEFISEYSKAMRKNSGEYLYNHRTTVNREKTAKRFKYVSPGGNWRQIPKDLMQNYKDRSRTHDHIYRRLIPDEPAFTIANFRKQMMIHPEKSDKSEVRDQNRLLSVREAARLQSFADDYVFPTQKLTEKQQMVGNAVPVRLSKAIAQALHDSLSQIHDEVYV